MVTRNQVALLFGVIQNKSEHPLKLIDKLSAVFQVQRQNHFTVRFGLEAVVDG